MSAVSGQDVAVLKATLSRHAARVRGRSAVIAGARRRTALAALVGAGLLAGCGLGVHAASGVVTVSVTREFGAIPIAAPRAAAVRGEETALNVLARSYPMRSADGSTVQSIAGHPGAEERAALLAWSYYVNGVEPKTSPAKASVGAGDSIWWDLHEASQQDVTRAVVGSFPEPFLHGIEGERLPVRIECAEVEGDACRTVIARMAGLGVPAGVAALGEVGEVTDTLRVAVGPWLALRRIAGARSLALGPHASGVYARISADGSSLELLDARGDVSARLSAGAGLVAAMRSPGQDPLWLITGTDAAGADGAAHALQRSSLYHRFAVALSPSAGVLALPRRG
jgi:hypothetical protein